MTLAEILTQAMDLEQTGRDFYVKAAELPGDEATAAMFRQLAEDELAHYGYLERQLAAVQCGEDVCAIPELGDVEPLDLNDPVFPSGIDALESLGETYSLEEALVFAMGAEDKSYKLYRRSAEDVEEPEAKQLFLKLAAVELKHFEALVQRYESFYSYPR